MRRRAIKTEPVKTEPVKEERVTVPSHQGDVLVVRTKKRRRTLSLSVEAQRGIVVRIPYYASLQQVHRLIAKQREWITSQQARVASRKAAHADFTEIKEGSSISFLGVPHTLYIEHSPLIRKGGMVVKEADALHLSLPLKGGNAGAVLEKWLRVQAEEHITARCWHFIAQMDLESRYTIGDILIRNQQSRWGSCDARNNLRFNWRIILLRPEVLDYLVVHELSHIVHKDHSRRFWACVGQVLPNYRALRAELRTHGALLEWFR